MHEIYIFQQYSYICRSTSEQFAKLNKCHIYNHAVHENIERYENIFSVVEMCGNLRKCGKV